MSTFPSIQNEQKIRATRAGQSLGSGIRPGTVPVAAHADDVPNTADRLVERLEQAGSTLLAMPARGYSTQMRQMRFDVVHTALEAYGWESAAMRAPAPGAAAISAMDEAFGWLALIPEQKFLLRRIVGTRALVHPLTQRNLFPWRRLAALLGTDHKSVQRWHGNGLEVILAALHKR